MAHSYISFTKNGIERTISSPDTTFRTFLSMFIKSSSTIKNTNLDKKILHLYIAGLATYGPGCIDLHLEKLQNEKLKKWYFDVLDEINKNLEFENDARLMSVIPDLINAIKWVLFESEIDYCDHIMYFENDVHLNPRIDLS